MLWNRQPWLIDHGAALSFHFDLAHLTEQTARESPFDWASHLFAHHAARVATVDAGCAASLSREVLAEAVAVVPDGFLRAVFPTTPAAAIRGVYTALLWKRLKPPRPFLPSSSAMPD
jgi:hypothetical protein